MREHDTLLAGRSRCRRTQDADRASGMRGRKPRARSPTANDASERRACVRVAEGSAVPRWECRIAVRAAGMGERERRARA